MVALLWSAVLSGILRTLSIQLVPVLFFVAGFCHLLILVSHIWQWVSMQHKTARTTCQAGPAALESGLGGGSAGAAAIKVDYGTTSCLLMDAVLVNPVEGIQMRDSRSNSV